MIEGGDKEKKTPHANEAALLIAKLRNSSCVPTSFVEEVLENVEEIFDNFVDHIQEKITKAAENVTDEAAKVELEQLLNETSNPFSDLKTEHQKRAYSKNVALSFLLNRKSLGIISNQLSIRLVGHLCKSVTKKHFSTFQSHSHLNNIWSSQVF